jgi:hypothetical protein
MQCTIETKASTILDFLKGLRGSLQVTFEDGTWAAWLYDLIKPYVVELVVCFPRRNVLLKEGSKRDRIDVLKLAEWLRSNMVRSVHHGGNGLRALCELARSYLTTSTDLISDMCRTADFQSTVTQYIRHWHVRMARSEPSPTTRSDFSPAVRRHANRIWGASAISSSFSLALLSRSGQRWFYFASLLNLIPFEEFGAFEKRP